MTISVQTYEQVALEDGDARWELVCGNLRKKPGMTLEHNVAARRLAYQLTSQLDPDEFAIDMNGTRLRVSTGSFYLPDLCVIPHELERRLRDQRPGRLEVYEDPMPLVVEVWSPSTGDYDVETKLKEYQLRGDAEIWRIHPYERTLTAWRQQPDGSYPEALFRAGIIEPTALPGVRINISALFD